MLCARNATTAKLNKNVCKQIFKYFDFSNSYRGLRAQVTLKQDNYCIKHFKSHKLLSQSLYSQLFTFKCFCLNSTNDFQHFKVFVACNQT